MRKIEGIVIHRAEVVAFRAYHVLVMRDGTPKRHIPDEMTAWHSVAYNQTTLAIAIFGDFAAKEKGRNWTPTEQQYRSCILQCQAWLELHPGIWIKGHSELGIKGTNVPEKLTPGHTCPGERFDLNRVRAECGLAGQSSAEPKVAATKSE